MTHLHVLNKPKKQKKTSKAQQKTKMEKKDKKFLEPKKG